MLDVSEAPQILKELIGTPGSKLWQNYLWRAAIFPSERIGPEEWWSYEETIQKLCDMMLVWCAYPGSDRSLTSQLLKDRGIVSALWQHCIHYHSNDVMRSLKRNLTFAGASAEDLILGE